MPTQFQLINYSELNSRQQEAYNYQKLSAILADYGFVTIRLSDDWQGADFIAQHIDGKTFLKAQLKGRASFDKKYIGRDLHICFREDQTWYFHPHDEILEALLNSGIIAGTAAWEDNGVYNFPRLSEELRTLLEPKHAIGQI